MPVPTGLDRGPGCGILWPGWSPQVFPVPEWNNPQPGEGHVHPVSGRYLFRGQGRREELPMQRKSDQRYLFILLWYCLNAIYWRLVSICLLWYFFKILTISGQKAKSVKAYQKFRQLYSEMKKLMVLSVQCIQWKEQPGTRAQSLQENVLTTGLKKSSNQTFERLEKRGFLVFNLVQA